MREIRINRKLPIENTAVTTQCKMKIPHALLLVASTFAWLLAACDPSVPGAAHPPTSTPRVNPLLAILWDPHRPDMPVRPTPRQVHSLLFGESPSIRNFYKTEFGGKFLVEPAGVVGWYSADKPPEHYWQHPKPGTPGSDEFISGHVEKWTEAIRKASKDFDFHAYDVNHDGVLDPKELAILIVIPQASPFGTNRDVAGQELPEWQPLVISGLRFTTIAEVYTGANAPLIPTIPMNFGVIAHELGHLFFGMPDLYQNAPTRAGGYSLMDVTYTDAQFDPYQKLRVGTLKARRITKSGEYHLTSVESSNEAYLVERLRGKAPVHPREFFLFENRQHGAYDTLLPDTGIAIWRIVIDESQMDWGRKNIQLVRRIPGGDDAAALWHASQSQDKSQPASIDLEWSDGSSAAVLLRDFSASRHTMTFAVELGYPSVDASEDPATEALFDDTALEQEVQCTTDVPQFLFMPNP